MNLLRLIRYRFFLFAGLLPFFLGQMIAFGTEGGFDWKIFSLGLLGPAAPSIIQWILQNPVLNGT